MYETSREQQNDRNYRDHNNQDIHLGCSHSFLVLGRIVATFTLSDLVTTDRIIADASGRGALPLSKYEEDSENDHEHSGRHQDLADDQQADPYDRGMDGEGENGTHHDEEDSQTETHDDLLLGRRHA